MISPTTTDICHRIIAHSADQTAWLAARNQGITASDAAALSGKASIERIAHEKCFGRIFTGNVYTTYGNEREPFIAQWAHRTHGFVPSTALFHAEHNMCHLATPDALKLEDDGTLLLAEFKTSKTDLTNIPQKYLRQIWWQQYVLNATRTFFVWEQHHDFVPLHTQPQGIWVERNETQIELLKEKAQEVLTLMEDHRANAS